MKNSLFGICCLVLLSNVNSDQLDIKSRYQQDTANQNANLNKKELTINKYDTNNADLKYLEKKLSTIPYYDYAKSVYKYYNDYKELPVVVLPDMTNVCEIKGFTISFKKKF
ncbi:MAG: hypothetical protein WC755_06445 [Candidatus Woesearchaeota archaeon]|jgi:hypothetical protein